jgi:hypothetical protein
MDWHSPKHVERILKNKVQSQEFCASPWFIYILQGDARFIQYETHLKNLLQTLFHEQEKHVKKHTSD